MVWLMIKKFSPAMRGIARCIRWHACFVVAPSPATIKY